MVGPKCTKYLIPFIHRVILLVGLGWDKGNTNDTMQELIERVNGPFTPLQWMELEHQALIYKYINAKAPVPSSLLISVCRSFVDPSMAKYLGNNRGNHEMYRT